MKWNERETIRKCVHSCMNVCVCELTCLSELLFHTNETIPYRRPCIVSVRPKPIPRTVAFGTIRSGKSYDIWFQNSRNHVCCGRAGVVIDVAEMSVVLRFLVIIRTTWIALHHHTHSDKAQQVTSKWCSNNNKASHTRWHCLFFCCFFCFVSTKHVLYRSVKLLPLVHSLITQSLLW